MEIRTVAPQIKDLSCLTVAYDVSKGKHNYMTGFTHDDKKCVSEGEIKNRSNIIGAHLDDVREVANEYGFYNIRIICEPTGGYEKNLLRQARRRGFFTEYVNGEATSKAKVIESNDASKNDIKDSRIIHMLAREGKTLTCDERTDVYGQLKLFNAKYEDLSLEGAQLKNRISSTVEELFPDLQLSAAQYYRKISSCVIKLFGLNPYIIAEEQWDDFTSAVSKVYGRKVGGRALKILEQIYQDAKIAQLNILPQWRSDELESVLRDYYTRREEIQKKKEQYKRRMTTAVEDTKEWLSLKSSPVKKFLLSRLLAETGPWDQFKSIKQLLRFGGLNLKERESGTYIGRLKLSKKGNILMRKVLGQLAFSVFSKKGALYGDYYQEKKLVKGGFYAITCVMRKVLKMMFGVYKSGSAFNAERVFNQHVQPLALTA